MAALVLSYLVSSIPGIGPALAPLLTPLLLIVGVGMGALAEMTDSSARHKLARFTTQIREMGVA